MKTFCRRDVLSSPSTFDFLSRTTETEDVLAPVQIEDLIADGESDELEFKSSLRWDLKEGHVNKKLEEIVVKTSGVCKFSGRDVAHWRRR